MLFSNFLIQLSQAQAKQYKHLVIPQTKLLIKLIKKLTKEGFLYGYKPIKVTKTTYQQKYIQIFLKYYYDTGVLTCLSQYHNYRLFHYISYKHLLALKNFSPVIFLQSPKGLLTQNEAIKKKTGGRIILICL